MRPKRRFAGIFRTCCLAASIALPVAAPLFAQAASFGPFGAPGNPVTRDAKAERPPPSLAPIPPAHFFWVPFRFYSRVVSPTHDARCSHRPTCSGYAIGAVSRFGMVRGGWMAIDRLMMSSQSSAHRFLPMVHTPAGARFVHPIDDALSWRLGLDLVGDEE